MVPSQLQQTAISVPVTLFADGDQTDSMVTSEESEVFECEFCHRLYSSKKILDKHVRLKHSKDETIYTCSICDTKCGEVTTILAHYKNKHKETITKEDAAKLGVSVPNSFVFPSVPKNPKQTVYCTCGSIFTSGISSFYKHVRNFHKSTIYSDYRLEKDESMPMNVSSLPMTVENGGYSSTTVQNITESDERRTFPISHSLGHASKIHSNYTREECIVKIRSKRSIDQSTETVPAKFSRYECINKLWEREESGAETMEELFTSGPCSTYQYEIERKFCKLLPS